MEEAMLNHVRARTRDHEVSLAGTEAVQALHAGGNVADDTVCQHRVALLRDAQVAAGQNTHSLVCCSLSVFI